MLINERKIILFPPEKVILRIISWSFSYPGYKSLLSPATNQWLSDLSIYSY